MAMHNRARRSRVYQEALIRAKEYLENPSKLEGLLGRAGNKGNEKQGKLKDIWRQFQLLIDMMRCYISGEYRDVSSRSMMLTIAALMYFVMPADLIPDILIGLGYLDDVAVLAWTINSISEELERFEQWRKEQGSAMGAARAAAKRNRKGLLIEGEIAKP